ncbi:unnamed protein product [Clonostachys rosea]|uniref:AMP-dependent synthetase/ligase domain-containing protein n=1 Tax=Bionectria ochroleuca TaxID=29856 RepID=A0ABY6UC01_BIOOC|nr:unnamed protein product [Clonostachys rosea]
MPWLFSLLCAEGTSVRQGWGMTEITCTCINWTPTGECRSAAVGELVANSQARLMSLDDPGTEVMMPNQPGELWVTGPTLMRGYWRNERATEDALHVDADGTRWLKTGDIAYVEAYGPGAIFHIVDRTRS